jgi:hypothetical protein
MIRTGSVVRVTERVIFEAEGHGVHHHAGLVGRVEEMLGCGGRFGDRPRAVIRVVPGQQYSGTTVTVHEKYLEEVK